MRGLPRRNTCCDCGLPSTLVANMQEQVSIWQKKTDFCHHYWIQNYFEDFQLCFTSSKAPKIIGFSDLLHYSYDSSLLYYYTLLCIIIHIIIHYCIIITYHLEPHLQTLNIFVLSPEHDIIQTLNCRYLKRLHQLLNSATPRALIHSTVIAFNTRLLYYLVYARYPLHSVLAYTR